MNVKIIGIIISFTISSISSATLFNNGSSQTPTELSLKDGLVNELSNYAAKKTAETGRELFEVPINATFGWFDKHVRITKILLTVLKPLKEPTLAYIPGAKAVVDVIDQATRWANETVESFEKSNRDKKASNKTIDDVVNTLESLKQLNPVKGVSNKSIDDVVITLESLKQLNPLIGASNKTIDDVVITLESLKQLNPLVGASNKTTS